MSASHPSEAEGRTPTPDDQLDELREYAIDHMRGYGMESRLAIGFLTFDALLAARSPAPSDEPDHSLGNQLAALQARDFKRINDPRPHTCPECFASHGVHRPECSVPPAAPSVEARDACPFTREDVELLTRCADGCDGTEDCEDDEPVFPDGIRMYMRDVKRLRSLVSRIASLLPPEKT